MSFIVIALIVGVFCLVAFVIASMTARNARLARRAEVSAAVAAACLTELRRLSDVGGWSQDEQLLISAAIQRVEHNQSFVTKELL